MLTLAGLPFVHVTFPAFLKHYATIDVDIRDFKYLRYSLASPLIWKDTIMVVLHPETDTLEGNYTLAGPVLSSMLSISKRLHFSNQSMPSY